MISRLLNGPVKAGWGAMLLIMCVVTSTMAEEKQHYDHLKEPGPVLLSGNGEDLYGDYHFHYNENDWWKDKFGLLRFATIGRHVYAVKAFDSEDVLDGGEVVLCSLKQLQNCVHEPNIVVSDIDILQFLSRPLVFPYADKYYMYACVKKIRDHADDSSHSALIAWTKPGSVEKDWDYQFRNAHEHGVRIYRGACRIGGYLYFVYDSYLGQEHVNRYDDEPYTIRVDKATIDNNHHIHVQDTYKLSGVMDRESHHPRDIQWYLSPEGHPVLLISYSGETTGKYDTSEADANNGGGVVVFDLVTHHFHHVFEDNDWPYAVRVAVGTAKGGRDPIAPDDGTARIQVIYNHFHNSALAWDDMGQFRYRTYVIEAENRFKEVAHGTIHLGDDSFHPDEWDRMHLNVVSELSMEKSSEPYVGGSYRKRIWMFYSDKNGHVRGLGFKSDQWHYIPEETAISNDLAQVKTYGDAVRGFWQLVGIVEGPPPCAIDWETWNANYSENIKPTRLSFEQGQEQAMTVELDSSDRFYTKASVEEAGVVEVTGEYEHTFQREFGTTRTVNYSISMDFELNPDSQGKGVFIYRVPEITRIVYGVFPWWTETHTSSHVSEFPKTYKFVSTGDLFHYENVHLSDPFFGLSDVNDEELATWRPDRNPDRLALTGAQNDALHASVEWMSPNPGQVGSLEKSDEHSVSVTSANRVSVELDLKVVPEVFDVGFGASFEWSSTTTVKTTFSQKVTVDYSHLVEADKGAKISGLDVTTYWFYKHLKDKWYVPRLADFHAEEQRPWYIGYVVTNVYPSEGQGGNGKRPPSPSRFTICGAGGD